MKKLLVIGVIVLFFGVACSPSIATVQLEHDVDSDFEEIIFQICEADSITNHSVMISKQQSYDLELLIDEFKKEVDTADTYEETVLIYQEMITSLDRIDVLPDTLGVEKAEEIVLHGNKEFYDNDFPSFIENSLEFDGLSNMFCLFSGDTTESGILGTSLLIPVLMALLVGLGLIWILDITAEIAMLFYDYPILFEVFNLIDNILFLCIELPIALGLIGVSLLLAILCIFLPLKLFNIIGYGYVGGHPESIRYVPADGWVNTVGLKGIKTMNGSFYGQYFKIPQFPPSSYYHYAGVIGFTGINICYNMFEGDWTKFFSIGTALFVRIDEDHI